ncbi:Dor1-domain-containing protein [Xylona heveae TC161]|uniref:Conserved oligomeric Golgi complex subunit 8 n=1 Tax=Xylona heveae (strain CBS 132557 / TC161) TaxID=1328760 RepID=A0A161TGL0_XYLHT|nr:Dor1-domain-containing protein [Xylona heveae TC161]KZF25307.1 Dor1-domain-containing protein [Xylona heveae TC161]
MADPLHELLSPYLGLQSPSEETLSEDSIISDYLSSLCTLSVSSLNTSEPQSLSQSLQSKLLSLQALSTRSYSSLISSSDYLSTLRFLLPKVSSDTNQLQDDIPGLDKEAVRFAHTFHKNAENPLLVRRKKAMLLARNVDRLGDMLDLPTLLSSAVTPLSTSSNANAALGSQYSSSFNANYASALELFAHIKRLRTLYPSSPLVDSIVSEAEVAMRVMTTNLISNLRTQGIKVAGGMRIVGWLRRLSPELDNSQGFSQAGVNLISQEDGLGALFLVCRLASLVAMLEALDPLRELAEQELERRVASEKAPNVTDANGPSWAGGQQTERYLKRYIEIFREQSFSIVSMYKSIFPSLVSASDGSREQLAPQTKSNLPSHYVRDIKAAADPSATDPLQPIPSSLSTFPLHLVSLLIDTLRRYLPSVKDKGARESLLTQVLYCAGSLGRLGGDFSVMLAFLEDSDDDDSEGGEEDEEFEVENTEGTSSNSVEWAEMIKKHRLLAGRLELLASGAGTSQNWSKRPSVGT